MPTYLVTIERLLDVLHLDRQVMEQMSGEEARVRDISCTLIPLRGGGLLRVGGTIAGRSRQLSERAGLPASRIVEAIVVTGA